MSRGHHKLGSPSDKSTQLIQRLVAIRLDYEIDSEQIKLDLSVETRRKEIEEELRTWTTEELDTELRRIEQ